MTEQLPISDPKIEYAQIQLGKLVDLYLSRLFNRLPRMVQMGVPQIFIDSERELINNRQRQIIICAEICGSDPSKIIQERARQLLEQFKQGNFHTGTYLAGFSREDIELLRQALLEPEESGLSLDFLIKSQERQRYSQWFEELFKEKEERKNIKISETIYFRDGKFKPGQWITVGNEDIEPGETLDISVPIIGGRVTKVHIPQWDESLFPREEEYSLGEQTFPISNALFYYGVKELQDPNIREVVAHSPQRQRELYRESGSYLVNLQVASIFNLREKLHRINPELKKKIRSIIFRDMKLPLASKNLPIAYVLWQIQEFIRKVSSNEEVEDSHSDLAYLLDSYDRDKKFPGDCKSISTLVVGFGEAIGIFGRRVAGSTFDTEENEVRGHHVWAEQFIPVLNSWVPNDPGGAFYTYPNKGEIYAIEGEFTPIPGIQIKVNFEELS